MSEPPPQPDARFRVEIQLPLFSDLSDELIWEAVDHFESARDALLGCSDVFTLIKHEIDAPLSDATLDRAVAPSIRVIDRWNDKPVLWSDENRLHFDPEVFR